MGRAALACVVAAVLGLTLAGCGGGHPKMDAGGGDAGVPDAGADGGSVDAHVPDAGHVDAGPTDAGPDGSTGDAGPVDAGPTPPAHPMGFVQTSGGAVLMSTDYRLRISIGAPQPMGTASDATHHVVVGPEGL